jgi:xanthine dehydrogenase molybdopterin-binding subunit B
MTKHTVISAPDLIHGRIVGATIARGRIINFDVSAAMSVKGVVSILTHQNLLSSAQSQLLDDATTCAGAPFSLLSDEAVMFAGQPVAMIFADTPEAACFATAQVQVEYDRRAVPQGHGRCDADGAMQFAATAVIEGQNRLSVYDHTDGTGALADHLDGRLDRGSAGRLQMMLAVRAALTLQRSVRLVLSRRQMAELAAGLRSSGGASAEPGFGGLHQLPRVAGTASAQAPFPRAASMMTG